MTSPTSDPHDAAATGQEPIDDVSIVPGLGPSGPLDMSKDPDRYDPSRDAAPAEPLRPTGALDMSKDPDRYDPTRDAAAVGGPLDMSLDPDRYRPPGQGQTLTDLLGEGAHEETRDNAQWAIGLLSIIAFLAFVSWFFSSVATP